MPKISVIIPIYNAEDFLEKCVTSVLQQTEKDIEVILVNDGSNDNSLSICNKIAADDDRVIVINQKNAGVSAARNNGINAAKGEYIGFVDADDWIDSNMYEMLLSEAKKINADIAMCDVMTVYSNGIQQVDTITQLSKNQILEKADFSPPILLEMAGSACRCIYKNYNDTRFPIGVKFSEDRIFNIYAFGFAKKTVYIKEPLYFRYINKKSAVHRFHTDYFEACIKAAKEIEIAIEKAWNGDDKYKTAYLRQLIDGALMAVCNYYYKTSTFTRKERIDSVKKICADSYLCAAIKKAEKQSIKSKFILKNRIHFLILYAKFANLKHNR